MKRLNTAQSQKMLATEIQFSLTWTAWLKHLFGLPLIMATVTRCEFDPGKTSGQSDLKVAPWFRKRSTQ